MYTLIAAGEPKRLFTMAAPRSGVVVNRSVTVGTSVCPPLGGESRRTLRAGLYGTVASESAGAQVITVPRDAVVDGLR